MGFGGGAMLAVPTKKALLSYFSSAPDYLGSVEDVWLLTVEGRRVAESGGEFVDVVVARS